VFGALGLLALAGARTNPLHIVWAYRFVLPFLLAAPLVATLTFCSGLTLVLAPLGVSCLLVSTDLIVRHSTRLAPQSDSSVVDGACRGEG